MGDLISRSALLELITNAQKLLETDNDRLWEKNKPIFKGLAWAHRLVLDAPAVDAVEVVRCKQCEHLGIKDLMHGYCKRKMCGMVQPDDFCSYGEQEEWE